MANLGSLLIDHPKKRGESSKRQANKEKVSHWNIRKEPDVMPSKVGMSHGRDPYIGIQLPWIFYNIAYKFSFPLGFLRLAR